MYQGTFSRNSLWVAGLVAALLAAAGNTYATPVSRTLDYQCQLPLFDSDLMVVDLTYDFPARFTGDPMAAAEATADITIPDYFVSGLNLVDADHVSGSIALETELHYQSVIQGATVPMTFPRTSIPTGSEALGFTVRGAGTLTYPHQFDDPLPQYIIPGDMTVTFDTRRADGTPTALGEFSAPCISLTEDVKVPVPSPEPEPIYIDRQNIDFGTLQAGMAVTEVITITNPGNDALTSLTFVLSGANSFFLSTDCPDSLAPGDSCSIEIVFAPAEEGSYAGTLEISSSIFNASVALLGASTIEETGIPEVVPKAIDFGLQDFGHTVSREIAIDNTGNGTLLINNILYEGSSDFFIDIACLGQVLAPGETCNLSIHYTPQTEGKVTGSVDIETTEGTIGVGISGEGGFIEVIDPLLILLDLDGSTYLARSESSLPVVGDIAAELTLPDGELVADLSLEPTEGQFAVIKGWNKWTSTVRIEFEQTRPTTGTLSEGGLVTRSEMYVKVPEVSVPILGMDVKIGGGERCRTSAPVEINLSTPEGARFSPDSGGPLTGRYTLPELENCGFLTGLLNAYMAGPGNALSLELSVND